MPSECASTHGMLRGVEGDGGEAKEKAFLRVEETVSMASSESQKDKDGDDQVGAEKSMG